MPKVNDYNKHIFNLPATDTKAQVGDFLVAQPFLDDASFKHAVVLLTDKNTEGEFVGFVMNRKSEYNLSDIIDVDTTDYDLPLYLGGPVSTDNLYFLHTLGDIITGGFKVMDNIYFGGDFEQLISYVNSGFDLRNRVRLFVGYSGWGDHQLAEEIGARFWAVAPRTAISDLFMDGGDSYWHRVIKSMGDEYKSWLYHPLNPQSN